MNCEINQLLKPLVKPSITREQLQEYAIASEDNNPIHLDEVFAKKAGFPSVIAHGMLSMAFLGDCLNYNFPPEKFELKKFSCRFKKVTFPGDIITSSGKIKGVNPDGSLIVTLWSENQSGQHTLEGEALMTPRT